MADDGKYYVVKKKALPEVLLKVVEAKKLLESERAVTVQEATEQVGLSRSSFYKYKDDIFQLSGVLKLIADYKANILTIHQTIPINGIALLTMSIEVLPDTLDVSEMFEAIESRNGVHYIKMLARE